ncbi:hypothetical protein O6P43_035379 [Quillaja saponaria]|uniref:Uncharacterized protein n=1 Tax=Quillaja saponaria TaxID=32244 RepID=A0AAD7KKM6_QUISA|nr:hypothetical protein O6P43_035379 [Quillaja saponaria]
MLLGSERKLVMLSATGLSPSRVQHSTASPSSNGALSPGCLLPAHGIQAAVRKVAYSGSLADLRYFQAPRAFAVRLRTPFLGLWVPRYATVKPFLV